MTSRARSLDGGGEDGEAVGIGSHAGCAGHDARTSCPASLRSDTHTLMRAIGAAEGPTTPLPRRPVNAIGTLASAASPKLRAHAPSIARIAAVTSARRLGRSVLGGMDISAPRLPCSCACARRCIAPASSCAGHAQSDYGWPAPLRRAFRVSLKKSGLGDRHPRDGKRLVLIDRPVWRRVRPFSFFAFHRYAAVRL